MSIPPPSPRSPGEDAFNLTRFKIYGLLFAGAAATEQEEPAAVSSSSSPSSSASSNAAVPSLDIAVSRKTSSGPRTHRLVDEVSSQKAQKDDDDDDANESLYSFMAVDGQSSDDDDLIGSKDVFEEEEEEEEEEKEEEETQKAGRKKKVAKKSTAKKSKKRQSGYGKSRGGGRRNYDDGDDDDDDDDDGDISVGPMRAQIYYDDNLYKTFMLDDEQNAAQVLRAGAEKLHLKSRQLNLSLFVIVNNTDIRVLLPAERPVPIVRRLVRKVKRAGGRDDDVKLAFLSTVSERNETMRGKAFAAWLNWRLGTAAAADDAYDVDDLVDGVAVLRVVEALGWRLLKRNKIKWRVAKDRHRIDNWRVALDSCRAAGVQVPGHVSPKMVASGDRSALFDVLWPIIFRVHGPPVAPSCLEFLFFDELLYWCSEQTRGYGGIDRYTILDSIATGMPFCALVHKRKSDAIDYDRVFDAKKKLKRAPTESLASAFGAAEQHFGVPQLLDAADFATGGIDELSVYLYLAVWHAYATKGAAGVAIAPPADLLSVGGGGAGSPPFLGGGGKSSSKGGISSPTQSRHAGKSSKSGSSSSSSSTATTTMTTASSDDVLASMAKSGSVDALDRMRERIRKRGSNISFVLPVFMMPGDFGDESFTFRTYAFQYTDTVDQVYRQVAGDVHLDADDFTLAYREGKRSTPLARNDDLLWSVRKTLAVRYLYCCKN
jgi:Calponin homology (CH) domain